jgi:SAM-dependent methyltransferase
LSIRQALDCNLRLIKAIVLFVIPLSSTTRTCDCCGSTDFKDLPFYYRLGDSRLQGKQCNRCSLMFLDPLPTPAQIEAMYSAEYFSERENYNREQKQKAYLELAAEMDFTRPQPHKFLDYILPNYPGRKFKLLEVGCGPGYLLNSLRLLGWDVQGLEISDFPASFGREQLGLPIQTGNIETDESFRDGEFEMIYMGDVIEHLTSPAKTVARFRRLLKPGGLLVLALPATLNLPALRLGTAVYKMLGRERLMDIPPYHLYEFTPATITELLERQGFKIAHLWNTVKKPSQIRLGGNAVEVAGKLLGQYPTYYLNRVTGALGDRIFLVAERPA